MVEYFCIISLIINPNHINNKKEKEGDKRGVREGRRKGEKEKGRKEEICPLIKEPGVFLKVVIICCDMCHITGCAQRVRHLRESLKMS